jgi:prepilin-type N-terminal cleavage/methylation domain-containing protein
MYPIVSYFNKIKNARGFTLIELLVVIAIIGILSSVVLASLNSARADARDSRRAQDMAQIRTALELCANDEGDYANCLTDAELAPDYIQTVPDDPSTEGAYTITSTDGSEYCISTTEWEGDDVPDNDTNCAGTYSLGTDGI